MGTVSSQEENYSLRETLNIALPSPDPACVQRAEISEKITAHMSSSTFVDRKPTRSGGCLARNVRTSFSILDGGRER